MTSPYGPVNPATLSPGVVRASASNAAAAGPRAARHAGVGVVKRLWIGPRAVVFLRACEGACVVKYLFFHEGGVKTTTVLTLREDSATIALRSRYGEVKAVTYNASISYPAIAKRVEALINARSFEEVDDIFGELEEFIDSCFDRVKEVGCE